MSDNELEWIDIEKLEADLAWESLGDSIARAREHMAREAERDRARDAMAVAHALQQPVNYSN